VVLGGWLDLMILEGFSNLRFYEIAGPGMLPGAAQTPLWPPACPQVLLYSMLCCQVNGAGTESKQMVVQ